MAQVFIVEAETADWRRRTYGEMHPHLGDGMLVTVARKGEVADVRALCDSAFASALVVKLQTLMRRAPLNRSRD